MPDVNEKMRDALVAYRYVQRKMLEKWSEGDERVKAGLWAALHKCEALADAALAEQPAQGKSERSNRQFLTPEWIAAEDAAGGVMAAGALATSEQPAQGEAVAQIVNGELMWFIPHQSYALDAKFRSGRWMLYTAPPAPSVPEDVALLDAVAANHWRLDPFDMPTGCGDADVGWRVVEYNMPGIEREVAFVCCDDPRAAIRAAMLAAASENKSA